MGKISDYANVLKSKLTDLLVVYQRNDGELETKNATLEQLGNAICGEQVHSDLKTDNQTIIGGINELAKDKNVASSLTTTDKSSLVGAVNEVNGAVGALNNPTELTITPYTGVTVTQSSKAYKITDRLICVNFEVTVPTASSSWVNCFDIDWNTAFSTSNFGVVSDGGTNHSIIQAFWSSNKILVRVNSPRAVQYRGQVLIIVK